MNARERDQLEKLARLVERDGYVPQESACGYLWNPTTQELIPILPGNQANRDAAIRRWDKVKERSK